MSVYAVIDTNVIISSLLTHNQKSPTRIVLDMVREGRIVPMVNSDITEEYLEVLSRSKFLTFNILIIDRQNSSEHGRRLRECVHLHLQMVFPI